MNQNNILLYLASQSYSRAQQLTNACFSFAVISQTADESTVAFTGHMAQYVRTLAEHKMNHVDLQALKKPGRSVIITADTLTYTQDENQQPTILYKPQNRAHAHEMLAHLRERPARVITAMCLHTVDVAADLTIRSIDRETVVDDTAIWFSVPADKVDAYLDSSPWVMSACAAAVVEGMGMRFFTRIEGSYSAPIGLDIAALEQYIERIVTL